VACGRGGAVVSDAGRLLIGTGRLGLLIYDGKTLKRFHTTTGNFYVTALAGSEAELRLGTLNDGLLYFHGGLSCWYAPR
jgi:hypothetical protein